MAYRQARSGRLSYFRLNSWGVPIACGLFASGRDAWRVSDIATNYFAERGFYTREVGKS
jgi:hypothetical protein